MRWFLSAVDGLARVAGLLAAGSLLLLTVVVLAEIVSVALLNRSLVFSWEYASFLMAAAFFLGLGWTLRVGGHVRVQLLTLRLPPAGLRAAEGFASFLGLLITSYLASALTGLAYGSWVDGSRTFTATATPLWIPQAVTAAGAVILALQLAARLVRVLAGLPPEPAADAELSGEH